jgi:hypothetical protein
MLTDSSNIYVGQPDIPAGLTISAYRQARPQQAPWWRLLLGDTLSRLSAN